MSDSVALTALLVSLVALITTVGQLLQQYFATADGYRRCQASVMGLWSRKTRLRWRWTEFRFETVFVIPRITYGPLHGDVGTQKEISTGRCSLVGTSESLAGSMTLGGWGSYDARKYYDSDELACWVPLLAQLHIQGNDIVKHFPQGPSTVANDTTVPCTQFVNKSWDFMPTDVVRPMASTTVSDCAIMARRLGMVWKTFDPSTGSMRAEGNGHVITSTMARSLGTILQYAYTTRDIAYNCHYIPVREADKLGFGLVEFDHRLFGPNMPGDLNVSNYAGISHSLPLVINSRHGRNVRDVSSTLANISRAIAAGQDLIPGLNDLVPLCSAMLSVDRPRASSNPALSAVWLNRIPAPNTFSRGLTASQEAVREFKRQLEIRASYQHLRGSKQSTRIARLVNDIAAWQEGDDFHVWIDGPGSYAGAAENATIFMATCAKYHAEMTEYLQQSRVEYRELVGQHIIIASCPTPDEIRQRLDPVDSLSNSDIDLGAGMAFYFQSLPKLVKKIQGWHNLTPPLSAEEIEDAWLSMMFRAFCWQRSHIMIEGVPPLPSEYWNSKMPVYIG
jgi:hypothetical protein